MSIDPRVNWIPLKQVVLDNFRETLERNMFEILSPTHMPIWSNIGLSYTIGKLLNSVFEQN